MDVGDWLRSVGLGQYEAAFRDTEIDVEVLPELTDADLEKLGAPLGHRKRLLKAIAGLSVPAGGSSPSAAPVSGPKADAGRAPTAHGDVLRSRGFDRACPRGSTPRTRATSFGPITNAARA